MNHSSEGNTRSEKIAHKASVGLGTQEKHSSEGDKQSEKITGEDRMVTGQNPDTESEGRELFAQMTVDDEYPQDTMAMKAQVDPNTIYYHQAIKEEDVVEFIQVMNKEIQG